jgi:carbon-monoxide dehydrogenase medium subunit
MNSPDYIAPQTLETALGLKQAHGENARVIAGGTDLVLRLRDKVYSPSLLLDLRKLPLHTISRTDDEMRLDAYVSLSQILEHGELASSYPALAEACRPFAGPPIRNRGTIGGNIVNASPAADLVPPLMAYDAEIVLSSSSGDRVLPLADFFIGPGQSVLGPDEILTQVRLPAMPVASAAAFIKLGQRRSMAISIVNVCARLSLSTAGLVSAARIVLGAVAPTPLRVLRAEAILAGAVLTDDLIEQAANVASSEVAPISDVRASKEYRLKMAGVLVRRALVATRDRLADGEPGD